MICPNCGDGFKPANSDFRPYCSESCQRQFISGLAASEEDLGERVELLEDLVRHCWVHSGYPNCGYNQMGSDLQAVYDEIISRKRD